MAKAIRNVFKNDKFLLSECNDGYYLYDYILGMNISMRAKTEQDALLESLIYYQRRLKELKAEFNDLSSKVDTFVSQVIKED